MKRSHIIVLLLLLTTLLSACGLLIEFDNLRRREPSDYYLFVPDNYTGEDFWPAFIGIHGFGGSGRDCLRSWMQYAEEYEFILICPNMAGADGGWPQSEGEDKIVAILSALAKEYNLKSKSFLAGFSAGGQFVIGYAFRYPNFVSGVSVISAGSTYDVRGSSASRALFLITVGEQDPNRIDLARDFHTDLGRAGFNSDFYIITGAGHEISPSAVNLTLELFQRTNP